jgi:hypothetical protein
MRSDRQKYFFFFGKNNAEGNKQLKYILGIQITLIYKEVKELDLANYVK